MMLFEPHSTAQQGTTPAAIVAATLRTPDRRDEYGHFDVPLSGWYGFARIRQHTVESSQSATRRTGVLFYHD
jgi:hypothetical protein